jgi:5,10-methenyltetrahydromethanopterin hydrogenase
MARMRANSEFKYDRKKLAVDEEFDTKSDKDAKILETAKRATRVVPKHEEKAEKVAKRRGRPPGSKSTTYTTRVVKPEAPTLEVTPQDPVEVEQFVSDARYYNRRDMQPDE